LNAKFSACSDATQFQGLIEDAHSAFNQDSFDDQFDNIAETAPDLKPELMYKEMGHIGSSIESKNIGNALQRCMYSSKMKYHALASVPDTNKVLIMSKCQALIARDKKTHGSADVGQQPKKQDYLLIMEVLYKPTHENEHSHDLGIFENMTRSYCTACVTG